MTYLRRCHPRAAGASLVFAVALLLGACSSTSVERGAEGAVTGAAAGAVGSMFAAAIFGGDIGEAAARGAAWGAGAGAVTGAVQGSAEDARRKEQEAARARRKEQEALARLREEIGPDTFSGLEALTYGKHEVALAYASTAQRSGQPDYELAAHWLEALVYKDQGDAAAVADRLPGLAERDPQVATIDDAAKLLDALTGELAEIRARYT